MVARSGLCLLVCLLTACQPQQPRVLERTALALALRTLPISWALLLIFGLAAAASLWAALLRRQVKAKTGELPSSLEALRRAQLFDVARNQVLETIAHNSPLPESLEKLVSAVEQQVAGAMCVILMPADAVSTVNRPDSPLIIAPGLPEALQTAFLAALPSTVGECGCLADERANMGEQVTTKFLALLRTAGMPFKEAHSCVIFSATGSVAGLLALFRDTPSAGIQNANRILASAARLASLARDHWSMHEHLLHEARHDNLTGLPNRVVAEDRLEQALTRAKRHNKIFAVLCIDLDGFKAINDELGHEAGDEVLHAIAVRLHARIRHSDTLARVGGDEFWAILEDCSGEQSAKVAAQSLIAALEEPICLHGQPLKVSASVGIAMYPQDAANATQLKRRADQAMYLAKSHGGRQTSFWSELQA